MRLAHHTKAEIMMELALAATGVAVVTIFLSWTGVVRRAVGPGLRPALPSSSLDASGTIARELRRARREILAPASAFSSPLIASVLFAAIRRGVAVHLLLNRAAEVVPYPQAGDSSPWQDLRILLEAQIAPAHERVILIVDRRTLVAGHFIFNPQAKRAKAHNLLVVKGYPDFVDAYARSFLGPNNSHAIGTTDQSDNTSPDSIHRPAA